MSLQLPQMSEHQAFAVLMAFMLDTGMSSAGPMYSMNHLAFLCFTAELIASLDRAGTCGCLRKVWRIQYSHSIIPVKKFSPFGFKLQYQAQTHKSTLKVIFADGFLWQTLQLVRIVKFLYPKVRPLMGKCRRGMDVEILASCRMSAQDWYFNKTYTGLLLLLTIRQGIVSIASNIRLSIVWSINSISRSVFESLASLVLCMKLWNG